MNIFEEYVETLRRELGLSAQDIAAVMEVGSTVFDNYIGGYVPPSQRAAARLIASLAIGPADGAELALPPEELPFAVELPDAPRNAKIYETESGLPSQGINPGALLFVLPCSEPEAGDILLLKTDGGVELVVYGGGTRVTGSGGERELSPGEFGRRLVGRVARADNRFE